MMDHNDMPRHISTYFRYKPFICVFLFFSTLIIPGCTSHSAEASSPRALPRVSPLGSMMGITMEGDLAIGDAAIQWRWIGIKTNPLDDCEDPIRPLQGWSARQLFDQVALPSIPPGLRPFCVYEGSFGSDRAVLEDLLGSGRLTALQEDRMAVGPRGTLEDALWEDLAAHFLDQAGATSLPTSPTAVRLAFLDTGATRETNSEKFRGNSPHGYTLVNLARGFLCDSSGCLAKIVTRLAMPYLSYHSMVPELSELDEAEGGYIGTIAGLAEEIRAEVIAWQNQLAINPSAPERLLINLSLAWARQFGGLENNVDEMPPDVQAVYFALADASCRGALITAAAGNDSGGPRHESGGLLPAAWERRSAPSFNACKTLLGTTPDNSDFPAPEDDAYRPLVHAVGGLRGDGEPLTNARTGGMPRLAAFADHAVIAEGTGSTAILTGSSVSVAVAASAAAAIWSFRPDLAAHDVMQALWESGDSLDHSVGFCLGGSDEDPCPIEDLAGRRVSVCAAVAAACAEGDGDCPDPAPTCGTWTSESVDLSDVDLSAFSTSAGPVDLSTIGWLDPRTPDCRSSDVFYGALLATDPCPQHQYHGLEAESWTEPQPSSDPCPACWIGFSRSGEGTLYVEIDDDVSGYLTNATLNLGKKSYSLGLPTLTAGDTTMVTKIPWPDDGSKEVSLSFTLVSSGEVDSVSSSVLVTEE